MDDLEKLTNECMQDPECKKAYEALQPERDIAASLAMAGKKAGITQEELSEKAGSDKEKQSSGQAYNPTADDIAVMRKRGTGLARLYNSCEGPEEQQEILHKLFAEVGKNVRVNCPFHIDFGCHTYIGDDTVINLNCTFLDAADICIGSRVLIGPDVKIYTTYHPTDSAERFAPSADGNYFKTMAAPVRIDDDTWIGGNVTILPGVHIGRNVVIGAGSVVTKDIPDNTIAVGNPCKPIRKNK